MDPEIERLVALGRSRGYSEMEIRKRLKVYGIDWKPERKMTRHPVTALLESLKDKHGHSGMDVAEGMLEGATLNLAGNVFPGIKARQDDVAEDHKVGKPVSNVMGALATAPLWPLKAALPARALMGAGAGAVASAAGADGSLEERMKDVPRDAAIGGVGGVALPFAVNKVAGLVKRAAQPFRSAATHVAEGAGPLLPEDAAARMAAQEALAPGTTTPVSVSPGMSRSTRVLGANAPLARSAQEAAEGRIGKLQEAMGGLSVEYKALLGNARAPLDLGDVNIRPVIVNNGMWPGDEKIELQAVQALRSTIRDKMDALRLAVKQGKARGSQLNKMTDEFKKLTKWLESQRPDIKELDAKWGLLSRARRSEEKTIKHIAQSRESYGSSRVAGIEPGSPGASLPSSSQGTLMRMFGPDRARLAEEANRLLLQPGQIPRELLQARARMAKPYQPGLLAPFAIGGEAEGLNLFE